MHNGVLWEKVFSLLVYPVKSCRLFFLFAWLMCCAVCFVGNRIGTETDFPLTFLMSLSDCYFLCVLLSLLKKIRLGWIVYVPVVLLFFSELFVIFFNHSLYNRYAVQLLLETDGREGSEFVKSVFFQPETFWGLGITLTIVICSYLAFRMMRKVLASRSFVRKTCLLLLSCWIVFALFFQIPSYGKLYNCFHAADAIACETEECMPWLVTPVVRFVYGIAYNSVLSTTELKTLVTSIEETRIDSCSFRCPFILLVIGESYNKHHCYLYNKTGFPNTPKLQKKADEGNLVPYMDVVSPFNHTHAVFKYMFSTWDDTCSDSWTKHTLFTAAFKKAGYNVFFVTNQFTKKTDDKYNVLGGTIFNQKRLSELQFTGRNEEEHSFDADLLSDIPPVKELTSAPTLLIVQLLGQHVAYKDRYPADKKVFKPSQVKSPFAVTDDQKDIAADYENATHYNDSVIDSLFNMFEGTDMVALYFADHGEEVFDWREKFMRTDEDELLPEVAHYQYEIPFMFYMTDDFLEHHEDIATNIRNAAGRPFILTDLPHLLFYLGGIGMEDYCEEKNLLSPDYDVQRKRIIRGSIDYDKLMLDFKKR